MSQEQTKETEESTNDKNQDVDEIIVEISEAELDKIKAEAAEYKDKHIRLYAEFDNMRKRSERDRMDLIKYASSEVILDLLDLVDDFERSLQAAHNDEGASKELVSGIELIHKRLNELLKKHDVKEIDALGKSFDPDYHEVLHQEETDEHEEGTILEVYQKGYCLGDRVVRTAKVKVAKKK